MNQNFKEKFLYKQWINETITKNLWKGWHRNSRQPRYVLVATFMIITMLLCIKIYADEY